MQNKGSGYKCNFNGCSILWLAFWQRKECKVALCEMYGCDSYTSYCCVTTISNGTIANGPRGNSFWQHAHKLLSNGISLSLAIMKGSLLC